MLARLSKTLSTNVAIAGLTAVVLGAGGASATLAAGHAPTPKPDATHAAEDADESETPDTDDAESPETPKADAQDSGTRPTDTHGFCVSQVAKSAPTEPTGEGADTVTHGSLVSAAAKACGKQTAAAKAAKQAAAKAHGKAFGRSHGAGRPAAVTPGASPKG